MDFSRYVPRLRLNVLSGSAIGALVVAGLLVSMVGGAQAAPTSVLLGTADSFGVLAGSGITNTGATTVNGDVGTYPTTSITGSSTLTITGTNHAGDAVTQGAKTDLITAYNSAAGEGPTSPISADLGGQTLTPGVYNSASSIGLTGALTLNGGGDPDSVFVFQAGSTLTTASASSVKLINGAQACNVFWQLGSSGTFGTGSSFVGTVIALTDISVATGVTIQGRMLARNGAVTLDTDTITKPSCAAQSGPDSTSTSTTASTTSTVATTTTTPVSSTTATPPPAVLQNAAPARSATAAKKATLTAAKAKAARALATKAARTARVATARAVAANTAARKAAAVKASNAATRAAAKAAAAKAQLAKATAARALKAANLAAAKARAAKARASSAAASSALVATGSPKPNQSAGFTG